MPNPRFESQTKRKLVRDVQLEKCLEELIQANIEKFFRRNPEFLEICIDRAKSRNTYEAIKDADKLSKKSGKVKVEKLLDANEKKERNKCTLFICEGDSAIGGLRSSRDKLLHGGISLKGKPMNVSQASMKDVLANKEFSDIMTAIGLSFSQKADKNNLRFSNIVFLADSDVDGGHINTLLTNFFYTYWPELFDQGMIQVTKAPLFEIITSSGKKLYAETEEELEHIKEDKRITIKDIMRNKGLGEMSEDAWKHLMSKKSFTKIKAPSVKEAKEMLEVCFGKDSQARKDLLLAKNKKNKRGI
jgi:DNA gyrase/topoisomerase IV subunit B